MLKDKNLQEPVVSTNVVGTTGPMKNRTKITLSPWSSGYDGSLTQTTDSVVPKTAFSISSKSPVRTWPGS